MLCVSWFHLLLLNANLLSNFWNGDTRWVGVLEVMVLRTAPFPACRTEKQGGATDVIAVPTC